MRKALKGILQHITIVNNQRKLCGRAVVFYAGILEQSIGARNRVGIGLSYWPVRAGISKESLELGTEEE